jgi:hypothetical protein
MLRLNMVKAVYPSVSSGTVMGQGTLILSSVRLRGLFLQVSKSVMTLAEESNYGQCEPLRFTQDIQSVEMYLISRRVKETVDEKQLTKEKSSVYKDEEALSLRLVGTFDASELCEERPVVEGQEWQLYCSFEAYAPHTSLYEEMKQLMQDEGVQVSL